MLCWETGWIIKKLIKMIVTSLTNLKVTKITKTFSRASFKFSIAIHRKIPLYSNITWCSWYEFWKAIWKNIIDRSSVFPVSVNHTAINPIYFQHKTNTTQSSNSEEKQIIKKYLIIIFNYIEFRLSSINNIQNDKRNLEHFGSSICFN